MMEPRTAAERYLRKRLEDPEYGTSYERARRRIDAIDEVLRALDARREQLGITKAELARRADVQPESVRRLFSSKRSNPTLATLSAVADALDLELRPTAKNTSQQESAA